MMSNSRKLKYFSIIVGMFIFAILLINFYDITAEEIVDYTPNNYFLAFLMMMGIFAIKSLSVFIPLPVLYVSSTLIFTSRWALMVNLIGLVITMTLPYLIGRYSTSELIDIIFEKYPSVNKINEIKTDNEFLLSFLIKLMAFIPNDISSLLLGSIKVAYAKFLIASIIVRTPFMVITTLTGLNFLKSGDSNLVVMVILALISVIILFVSFRKYKREFK